MKIDDLNKTKRELAMESTKELLRLQERLAIAMVDTAPDEMLDMMITKNKERTEEAKGMLQITEIMKSINL